MKQLRRFLIAVMLAVTAVAGVLFAACTQQEDDIVVTLETYDEQTITLTGEKGEAIEFPDVTRTGYLFDGWYASADFSGDPVTSAVFEQNTTYYAKWSAAYALTLELDGGALADGQQTTLYLREGDVIADALTDYAPVKGDLQFGGWYQDGALLSQAATMPASAVSLTARYMAQYTVNVYLQKVDQSGYDFQENYANGYALIGETFAPSVSVTGFARVSGEGDKTSLPISEDAQENVFVFHFDRNEYTLILNENQPDGSSSETTRESYVYGEEVALPGAQDMPEIEGYRFFGWASFPNATFADVVDPDGYTLTDNTVLYAVWNKGYTDLFNGDDLIFLNHDAENTAILCRGGIDIPGVYVERNGFYLFTGDDDYALYALLDEENGTFIFYSDGNNGTYFLYENNAVDSDAYIVLQQTAQSFNSITYSYLDENETRQTLSGTYTISEEGYYIAEFTDGTEFSFLIGSAGNQMVFRIRGDEYSYGAMALMGEYYPVILLDGFGNASVLTGSDADVTTYSYTMNGDVFTLSSMSGEAGSFRIMQYGSEYGFEVYTEDLDDTFTGTGTGEKGGALTLDGCSNAQFTSSTSSYVGTYTAVASQRGGYIVTVTAGANTYCYWVRQETLPGTPITYGIFEVLNTGYTEYVYCSEEGDLGVVLLVDNGDGTATLYEVNDTQTALEAISSGTFTENVSNGTYTYIVDENGTVSWAQTQISSMVVGLDSSTGLNVYYVRESTANESGDGDAVFAKEYKTADEKSTLIVASEFAILIDAEGNIISGVRTDYTNYTRLAGSDGYYHYFIIDEEAETFEILSTSPLVLTKRQNNSTDRNTTLTVTGRTLDEEETQFEAIYSTSDGNVEGYYTVQTVTPVLGYSSGVYVYTFTANDASLTFRFLFQTSTSSSGTASYYFVYFDAGADVVISEFTAIDTNGMEDDTQELSVVVTADNQCVLVYKTNVGSETEAETSVRGSYTSEEVDAFGITATVYTFTSLEGQTETQFRFTLVSGNDSIFFRLCESAGTYQAADGKGTLELNGDTLAAKYTAADGTEHVGIYARTENVLDPEKDAVMLILDDGVLYFDLDESGTTKTFTLRSSEAGTYLLFENGSVRNISIRLDGYGNATVTHLSTEEGTEDTVLEGSYTITDGICTVTLDTSDDVYIGRLGALTVSGTSYNAFFTQNENIADAYLDRSDLSVLVLDDIGNVTKYNARGQAVSGTYVLLDDGLFYYLSSDQSDAAMYTISEDGNTVTAADWSATYYADDFASIVFYANGIVQFNNANATYFTRDADGKIWTYTPSEENGNAYGYVRNELAVGSDGTITYRDPDTEVERTYTLSDGKYITFTNPDGSTLEFAPSGATFTVEATYTPAPTEDEPDPEALNRYVVVDYDDEGNVEVLLAYNAQLPFSGSSNNYNYTVTNPLTISYNDKTFSLAENDSYQLTFYDYTYLSLIASYGSSFASLFEGQYGYVSVTGTPAENGLSYAISGQFNFLKGTDDEVLSFTDGKLSKAGYYNSNYGHLYTLEFTGSDGALYHMNFYAAQFTSGIYCYIIYSLTRATELCNVGDGTVIYSEEFVYTTGFNIVKETDEITGEETYFQRGDAYFPSIKYKGEVICTTTFTENSETEWTFASYALDGSVMREYDYVFTFTKDGETITNGSVARRTTASCEASGSTAETNNLNGSTVYFLYDMDTGEIIEVYAVEIRDVEYRVTECVKADDGSLTFTITLSSETGPMDGKTCKVTFTETTAPAEGEEDSTKVTVGGKTYSVMLEEVTENAGA